LSTLYIRLPSKAAADNTPHWITLPCPFALTSQGDAIEREGLASLSDLAETIARVQRVVLLLAAGDVTLLRIQVPPLSASRLKAALPNMIEDQLMSDPEDCVIVAGAAVEGLRTVAVVNRGWFDILVKTLQTYGANRISAVPAQLCLPYEAGVASAAVTVHGTEIDVAIRLAEQQGIGLPVVADPDESEVAAIVQTLCTIVPEAPIHLYVPQAGVQEFQEAANAALTLDQRITVHADNWPRWIAGAHQAAPDMMSALGGTSGQSINWRTWRWPLILTAVVLLVNIAGLNIDWLRMKREATALRAGMMQTYRSTFPQDTMVVDPLAQMRRKVAEARNASGQAAPDDFIALAANLGEVWDSIAGSGYKMPGIASLEYRDRSLLLRAKTDGTLPAEQLKAALGARNLSLTQQSIGVWQIRSGK
jgi:general secretion pathway protein L